MTLKYVVLPSELPGAPESPQVSDIFKDCCTITWQAPASDGGAAITGYWLERRQTSSSRWMKVNKEAVTDLTVTDTQLIENNEYEYRVMAENKAGVGPASNASQPFTAKDPWRKFQLFEILYSQ